MSLPERLIIVADDFGYCGCRSVGIVECSSSLSSTSVLTTHPSPLVLPSCGLGLHLNLTEGKPLTNDASSLIEEESGCMLGKLGIRKANLNAQDVRKEILAQIGAFEARYGRLPAHVDGHNHAHLLPVVATELALVLTELERERRCDRIRTRVPRQAITPERQPWIPPDWMNFFEQLQRECDVAAAIFDRHGVPYTRAFIGLSTQGGGVDTRERVLAALHEAAEISPVVEWMVHPGHACTCAHKGDEFSRSPDRDAELELVKVLSAELRLKGVVV